MKKHYFFQLLLVFLCCCRFAMGQAPQLMSYQAVIRDGSGTLVKSMPVGIRFSILQGSTSGTAVYAETQTVTTNINGVLTAAIGSGSVVSGSMADIDWSAGPYFIKTETDPSGGTSYTISGTTQLLSVPYALYAKTSGSSLSDTAVKGWLLKGNTGTHSDSNFIGTTDDKDLIFKRNNIVAARINDTNLSYGVNTWDKTNTGVHNTAVGNGSLHSNTSGDSNTAVGHRALAFNTSGKLNVAIGVGALDSNITGSRNIAIGTYALQANKSWDNTAIGISALRNNIDGSSNIAVGYAALSSNASGSYNIALGRESLLRNTTGDFNIALGGSALASNSTGYHNIGMANFALYANTTGVFNIALGESSLAGNTTGSYNCVMGYHAEKNASGGSYNVAIGAQALEAGISGSNNTGIGTLALQNTGIGSYNTGIGAAADFGIVSSGLNNTVCIGYNSGGVVNASNRTEIGNTSMSWIGGQVAWSTYSDKRIKTDIKENVPGLDFIKKLRPVTYRIDAHKQYQILAAKGKKDTAQWVEKYNIEKVTQTGFIAQEVADAAKTSGYNFSGVHIPENETDLYSIRYSDFVMPLVKAVQEQQALIEQQQSLMEKMEQRIKELEKRK